MLFGVKGAGGNMEVIKDVREEEGEEGGETILRSNAD